MSHLWSIRAKLRNIYCNYKIAFKVGSTNLSYRRKKIMINQSDDHVFPRILKPSFLQLVKTISDRVIPPIFTRVYGNENGCFGLSIELIVFSLFFGKKSFVNLEEEKLSKIRN